MHSGRARNNRHKLKQQKFQVDTRKNKIPYEDDEALAWVVQRGCEISAIADFSRLSWQNLEEITLNSVLSLLLRLQQMNY